MERYLKVLSLFLPLLLLLSSLYIHGEEPVVETGIRLSTQEVFEPPLCSEKDLFIENKGQWNGELHFIGDTSFGQIGFGINSIYYKIMEEESFHVIEYEFRNAGNVCPEGRGPDEYYENYFIGNDPDKWVSRAGSFHRICYEDLWEGIDIEYYFTSEGLKYDIILSPGADPEDIDIDIRGPVKLKINDGDLELISDDEVLLEEKAPVTYYSDNNEVIRSSYELENGHLGFELEEYDKSREVVIDPLLYSTFIGGSDHDYGEAIAIDSNGNAYITGLTSYGSINFPITPGTYDITQNGGQDVFVTKINSAGSSLSYSTFIGGSNDDYSYGIAIDSSGNAYITGITHSENFPTTSGVYDTTHNGNFDVFVTKLNSTGSSLNYSTFIGGFTHDYTYGIAIDSNGSTYITGITYSDDYPTTLGAYDTTYNAQGDIFITKINPAGSSLLYSTFIGGNAEDYVRGVKIDSNGNAFIGGYTQSSNFPTTSGAYDTSFNGQKDVVVTKLSSTGSSLVFSTFIGGSSDDEAFGGIAIDSNGNAYVTGETLSIDYPTTPGAYDTSHNGLDDVFVSKLNSTGSSLDYSTYLGGSLGETAYGIDTDYRGQATIIGLSGSSNYPITSGAYDTSLGGEYDVILTKLNSSGSSLVYSTFLGGTAFDRGNAVALDHRGNIFVTGFTDDHDTDYPTTPGAYDTTPNGNYDVFVSRIDFAVNPTKPLNPNGTIGNGFINITWEAPISDGGADISNYNIYRGTTLENIEKYETLGNITSYNDTDIVNGNEYHYYITAVNYAGESPSSEVLEIYDDEGPGIEKFYDPGNATTGDPYYFSFEFKDNVRVSEHFIEYWFGDNASSSLFLIQNLSLPDVKSGMIVVPEDMSASLNYDIVITDPSNNRARIPIRNISVMDNDAPELIEDLTTLEVSNRGTLNVIGRFSDNIGIKEIQLFVQEERMGPTVNHRLFMQPLEEDKWLAPVVQILDDAIGIRYHMVITDESGNSVETKPVYLEVEDDILPSDKMEDLSDERCFTGSEFHFSVLPVDNIKVSEVQLRYWMGDGQPRVFDLVRQGKLWNHSIQIEREPPSLILNYYFTVYDTSENMRESQLFRRNIEDTIPPKLRDLSNDTATTGDDFLFKFEISDNVEIFRVELDYYIQTAGISRELEFYDENRSFTIERYIPVPSYAIGNLTYRVRLKDGSGNVFEAEERNVTISDNDPPILDLIKAPDIIGTGEIVRFHFESYDNFEVTDVKAEYWFSDQIVWVNLLYDLSAGDRGTYYFDVQVPSDSLEPLFLRVHSTDSSGLTKRSLILKFEINDTISPDIDPIEDIEMEVDEVLDITPIATDNIGIKGYEWEGSPIPPYEGKLLGKVRDPGEYTVRVTVFDEAGNSNSTTFNIKVKDHPEGPGTARIGLLVAFFSVLIIAGAIVFFVVRYNKKEKERITGLKPRDGMEKLQPQPRLSESSQSELGPKQETIIARAPTPVKNDEYQPPKAKVEKDERKQTVKGELGPKQNNLLNPKR